MNPNYFSSVERSLHKYYGSSVKLFVSTRKDKKFMIITPDNKKVHFGQRGFDDYHTAKDKVKQHRFLQRNARWANAPKWTPAHLAFWVLWN